MLRAALRDLQWRWKRFVIAMIGVALVFAMGLIMTALTASFSLETGRTLHSIGAERWAVAIGRLRAVHVVEPDSRHRPPLKARARR